MKNCLMKRENLKLAVTWLETKRVKVISEQAIISIWRKATCRDVAIWNLELKTYLDTE